MSWHDLCFSIIKKIKMKYLEGQSYLMYGEAVGYLETLKKKLDRKSRFTNELLYNIVALCTEKLFMTILIHNNVNATHHTPMALYKEADKLVKLPVTFRETISLISRFESICLFESFGYKTPDDEQLIKMIHGLVEINDYISGILGDSGKLSEG